MDHSNPYTPPASRVASRQRGLAGSTRILLMCLIGAQFAVALLSLPGGLQLVQHGDISPLALLGAVLATGVLALGGALVVARRRPVTLLFIAAALGVLTALQWHPPFVFTCIAIGSLSAIIALLAGRPARTVP
jgi:fucose 4-O-acetylase-like acetyltransferase